MSLSPILTGVGVAAGAVLSGAARAVGDSISFAAELAQKPLVAKDRAKPAEAKKTPEQERDALLQNLRERLTERLTAAGVNLNQPIVLEANTTGTLRVTNDHPQWRAIEQVLGEDESFASQFSQLQSAVVATGVDAYSVRDMGLELSREQAQVILPR